ALVRLDQDTERALFAGRRLRHEIFERDASARRTPALRLAIEALTALRDIACRGRVVDDKKLVAGHRHAFHTKHLCRNGRTGGLMIFPRSSNSARTRPENKPQMKSSPTRNVPLRTRTVATGPLPGSSCASTTEPSA